MLEDVLLAELKPATYNPRRISEQHMAALVRSMTEFGCVDPIIINADGTVIGGHQRVKAAEQMGLDHLPAIRVDLDPERERLLNVALNNISGEWDEDLLASLLVELAGLEADLSLTGFSDEELARYIGGIGTEGLTDPDEVPEPSEVPISQLGDLWLLGRHRLLCGDSTCAEDVRLLMDGERAGLMATDPPYLVDYDGGNHPQSWVHGRLVTAEEKTRHWDAYTDHEHAVTFYRDFLEVARSEALAEAFIAYQWFGMMRIDVVLESWKAAGLLSHQVIIWHKNRPVLARCDFMWDYEPCMYGWPKGARPVATLRPPANARCVWDVDQKEGVEEGLGNVHPTIKPVELIRRPIEWHTSAGALIYEPFSGSGTAIIAAEMTRRRCFALELSPAFVDVAVQRWENFTGEQAVRAT